MPSSLGAEAQAMSVALGFVEWATLFLQELIHGPFDLQGAQAVMQERPPVCVVDCKSLYDRLSAVGSPSTLQDKRSGIDVLIIRVFEKDKLCDTLGTTGLQLADGLTKRQGRGCRVSTSKFDVWVVMQERHLTRVNEQTAIEKSPTVEQSGSD